MTLQDLVTSFVTVRAPGWLVLSSDEALNSAIEAAQFYAGYGNIQSLQPDPTIPITDLALITETVDVTAGEWAIIRPLFVLYLEFENAQRLEASRSNGLEVYGRASETVKADILQLELEMPNRAFAQPVRILGVNGTSRIEDLPPAMFPMPPYPYGWW